MDKSYTPRLEHKNPDTPIAGALLSKPWRRFHIPLIKPDMQISRIRLSDKTSRLRPRLLTPPCRQTYEPEVPVQVREWIAPALLVSEVVFEA